VRNGERGGVESAVGGGIDASKRDRAVGSDLDVSAVSAGGEVEEHGELKPVLIVLVIWVVISFCLWGREE